MVACQTWALRNTTLKGAYQRDQRKASEGERNKRRTEGWGGGEKEEQERTL